MNRFIFEGGGNFGWARIFYIRLCKMFFFSLTWLVRFFFFCSLWPIQARYCFWYLRRSNCPSLTQKEFLFIGNLHFASRRNHFENDSPYFNPKPHFRTPNLKILTWPNSQKLQEYPRVYSMHVPAVEKNWMWTSLGVNFNRI